MLKFFKTSFQKVKNALNKTRSFLGGRLKALFGKPWDDATFEEFEQILYEADLGSSLAAEITDKMRSFSRKHPEANQEEIITHLKNLCLEILQKPSQLQKKTPSTGEPLVILIVGVNGSGKTTSIAKLAHLYQEQGKKVLLAAADTFRAAAIEQLETWAQRTHTDFVKGKSGSDPSAIVFDALTAAKARAIDIVLIDTAGRLQNKTDLMQELEKIRRVCTKVIPSAPHETLLILDATIGQNALDQAEIFHQFTPLSGILLAKLDGSAKGGIALSIYRRLGIPLQWIGVGEKMTDLLPFEAEEYISSLFE